MKTPPDPDDVARALETEHTFRDVISLQAIVVTLTIGLLAYIQQSPRFDVRVEMTFLLLAAVPLNGLRQIVTAHLETPSGDSYLYSQPVRAYARQALVLGALMILGAGGLYWAGLMPGQVAPTGDSPAVDRFAPTSQPA
jgi:hypothetical protein